MRELLVGKRFIIILSEREMLSAAYHLSAAAQTDPQAHELRYRLLSKIDALKANHHGGWA